VTIAMSFRPLLVPRENIFPALKYFAILWTMRAARTSALRTLLHSWSPTGS